MIYEQTTFLMTDGVATISLPPNTSGNSYYVVIKFRNAIETWSKNPVLITPITTYNFTTGNP